MPSDLCSIKSSTRGEVRGSNSDATTPRAMARKTNAAMIQWNAYCAPS